MSNCSLFLEVNEDVIFYDRSDGSMGYVYPSGSLNGLSFTELETLGSGKHLVVFDNNQPVERGQEPIGQTEDDELFLSARFWLFTDRSTGVDLAFPHILMAFTPGNAKRISSLLTESYLARLKEYSMQARNHPETPASIYSSSGVSTNVPAGNLEAISQCLSAVS